MTATGHNSRVELSSLLYKNKYKYQGIHKNRKDKPANLEITTKTILYLAETSDQNENKQNKELFYTCM